MLGTIFITLSPSSVRRKAHSISASTTCEAVFNPTKDEELKSKSKNWIRSNYNVGINTFKGTIIDAVSQRVTYIGQSPGCCYTHLN